MKHASPPGPGTDQKVVGRSGRSRQPAWASVPLWSFGLFSFAPFFYVAVIRRRKRDWAVFAAYLAVVSTFIAFFTEPGGSRGPLAGLYVLLIGFAATHVFIVLRPRLVPCAVEGPPRCWSCERRPCGTCRYCL